MLTPFTLVKPRRRRYINHTKNDHTKPRPTRRRSLARPAPAEGALPRGYGLLTTARPPPPAAGGVTAFGGGQWAAGRGHWAGQSAKGGGSGGADPKRQSPTKNH